MRDRLRRTLLRAASAAGCGTLIPRALAADGPKKGAGASGAAAAAGKASQASVRYQAKPNGDQKCANCANFMAESGTCRAVEGRISPEGWCVVWIRKA